MFSMLLKQCQNCFPGGSDNNESACNAEELGSALELGRSIGEGNGYQLQYSGLKKPMDRGAWKRWDPKVHGILKSQHDFHFSHVLKCLMNSRFCYISDNVNLVLLMVNKHLTSFSKFG